MKPDNCLIRVLQDVKPRCTYVQVRIVIQSVNTQTMHQYQPVSIAKHRSHASGVLALSREIGRAKIDGCAPKLLRGLLPISSGF